MAKYTKPKPCQNRKINIETAKHWDNVNKFNRELTQEFLQQEHYSKESLKQYESGLKIFFCWVLLYLDNKPLYELKPRDALKYQNFLISLGLSSSAVLFKRRSVSVICNYLELYYNDEYPSFRNIYNKSIPNPANILKNEKSPITRDEFHLLVKTLLSHGDKYKQQVAWLYFAYATAARSAELSRVKKEVANYNYVKDNDGKEKKYYATHKVKCKGRGSSGEQRQLYFDDNAMDSIREWLDIRGEDDCDSLFVIKYGNEPTRPAKQHTFNYWCTYIFSPILQKRIHPHQIRMSRATDVVAVDGKDIKSAQKLLGHKSSNTTEIYIVRNTDDDIDDVF